MLVLYLYVHRTGKEKLHGDDPPPEFPVEEKEEEEEEERMEGKLAILQRLAQELGSLEAKQDGLSSPSPKLQKGGSRESAAIDTEPEFVKGSWTPSPASKQLTVAASLKKVGCEAEVIKVSSPGAKQPESLKGMLQNKVCRGPMDLPYKSMGLLTTP